MVSVKLPRRKDRYGITMLVRAGGSLAGRDAYDSDEVEMAR